jgi:hypothetical protein
VIPGYERRYYDVTDDSVDVEIPVDPNGIVAFSCDWYNTIDEPTYGGVYIHKYGCPQGYGTDSTFEELASHCYTIVRGAEYEIEGPGGYADSRTLYDVDLGWENLEPGDYTVSETPPSGYRDSKVWCAYGSYEGDGTLEYDEVDVESGGIGLSLEGGRLRRLRLVQPARPRHHDPRRQPDRPRHAHHRQVHLRGGLRRVRLPSRPDRGLRRDHRRRLLHPPRRAQQQPDQGHRRGRRPRHRHLRGPSRPAAT